MYVCERCREYALHNVCLSTVTLGGAVDSSRRSTYRTYELVVKTEESLYKVPSKIFHSLRSVV